MYLLTKCAACAAPLETGIKRCSRCKTRYCSAACQREHWRRGGHKATCEIIASRGGAEVFHVSEQSEEAIFVATEACREAVAGATCRICGRETDEETGEGLVRGCSCDGPAGCVHLSCLAVQAAKANSPGRYSEAAWAQWRTCARCHQEYHGVVRHAVGWTCWLRYVRTEKSVLAVQCAALLELAIGLMEVKRYQDAHDLFFNEIMESPGFKARIYYVRCCRKLQIGGFPGGVTEFCRGAVSRCERLLGNDHELTHLAALDLGTCLLDEHSVSEAVDYLFYRRRLAENALGVDHAIVIELGWRCVQADYRRHFFGYSGFRIGLHQSLYAAIHVRSRSARVLGDDHPLTVKIEASMKQCFAEQLDWTLDDFPADLREWAEWCLG